MDPTIERLKNHALKMDEDFIYKVYKEHIDSKEYNDMVTADKYYNYEHDILNKSRWAIGEKPSYDLPDERIIDNQYEKMVSQKNNYFLSKPFKIDIVKGTNEYKKKIKDIFNFKFRKSLKKIGKDAINIKRGYLLAYIDENGVLDFKKLNPLSVIPFFKDEDEQELDAFIRFYDIEVYTSEKKQIETIIEFYNNVNIKTYKIENGKLIFLFEEPYATRGSESYMWNNGVPLFVFEASENPVPLLNKCKSLQDGINTILSIFGNNMQEDARSTVLVVKNYDGQDWAEFRSEMMGLGVIPTSGDGGVDALQIEVNAENYESILKILKKALIENCKGFDAKDDRVSGSNFNQMNIQSMYNDIELDAADMELEFQTTLEELVEFINSYLGEKGEVKFTFNRNVMMNTSQVIDDLNNSNVSLRTKLENDPYCDDVDEELERLEEESKKELARQDDYDNIPFNYVGVGDEQEA